VYDAAGVRRQAGIHAQRINVLFDELLHGHMLNEKDLREVLGHTPLEVAGGVLLGLIVATAQWLIWK
jgi:acid phosphatase family membrane protein YuiD